MVVADQKPESAHKVSSSEAPARWTRPASSSDAPGQLVDEAGRAAGGVGPPGALAGVQHLAAFSTGDNKRVVATVWV